jgi:hypothetical protein
VHGVSFYPGAQMVVSNITILTTGAPSVAAGTVTQSGLLRSRIALPASFSPASFLETFCLNM